MADNTTLNVGAGGDVISDEDIAGVKVPRGKLVLGAHGVDGGDVALTNPLPVELSDATNVIGVSAHPLRVDPTGTTTQPISAAALPLPAGASTAAKQPAIGTAGTASADVISVQGIASMTAIKTDGSGVTQPDNLIQLAGTAVDVNSGNKSAGTLRVVVATDQPALANAQPIYPAEPATPVTGALAADITTTASTQLLAAPGIGVRNYITQILVSNAHATVGTRVDILDGAALLYTGFAVANGGGYSVSFNPPLKQPTTNTAINVVAGTTGAQLRASANGYTAA